MTSDRKYAVWIVEDDPVFKESLEELITSQSYLNVELSVSSAEEALEGISDKKSPDIILHDIGLPGKSGIEALPFYKEEFPDTLIIMLTIFEDDQRVFKAIKSGADGYLLKRSSGNELLAGIQHALNGGSSVSPEIARKLFDMLAKGGPKKESNLTPRQKEILELLVEGMTMDMISGKLEISSGTVDSHIKNIYKKLKVHSRAEVVAKAIKERLI